MRQTAARLCRGCTHSPRVILIAGGIDNCSIWPPEYERGNGSDGGIRVQAGQRPVTPAALHFGVIVEHLNDRGRGGT